VRSTTPRWVRQTTTHLPRAASRATAVRWAGAQWQVGQRHVTLVHDHRRLRRPRRLLPLPLLPLSNLLLQGGDARLLCELQRRRVVQRLRAPGSGGGGGGGVVCRRRLTGAAAPQYFVTKNRRHAGKSQSKRPATTTQRPAHHLRCPPPRVHHHHGAAAAVLWPPPRVLDGAALAVPAQLTLGQRRDEQPADGFQQVKRHPSPCRTVRVGAQAGVAKHGPAESLPHRAHLRGAALFSAPLLFKCARTSTELCVEP
jgi:hypothetical protein